MKIEEDVTTAQDLITVRGHQLTIAIVSSVTGRLHVVPEQTRVIFLPFETLPPPLTLKI